MAIYSDSGFITARDTPLIRPTLDLNFAREKRLDSRVLFTRDSSATYTDEDGIIRTVPNNVPRFDHDPTTGESLGLLIEESRTNSQLNSQPQSGSFTGGSATITYNTATAPNGETEACRIARNGTNTSISYWRTTGSITFDSNSMVLSCWAKGQNGNNYFVWSFQNLGGAIVRAGFLLTGDGETQIITNGNGGHTLQIEKYPDGWYRCIIIGNTQSSGTTTQFLYTASAYNEDSSAIGGSTLVWGFQLEAGAFPTSYIPTSGSTVTRAADLASISGTNFAEWYNPTEGTAFVDVTMPNSKGAYGIPSYAFKLTSDSNRYYGFSRDSVGPYHYINTSDANTYTFANLASEYKSILTIKEDDINSYVNGNQNVSLSSVTLFTPDILYLGSTTSENVLNSHIKQFKYYNRRLSNTQLQALTS